MYSIRTHVALLAALIGFAVASHTSAQQKAQDGLPQPRITFILPNGGKAGSTFDLAVNGFDLDDAESLMFSTPGVKVERLEAKKIAPDPKQKGAGGKDMKGPLPTTSVTFRVTLPANAALGAHDLRLVNRFGVSNSRAFLIGDLDESVEKEANNDVDQAHRIALNSTVSGVIAAPTDVDYYVFAGKAGQRVVVSCLTTSIDSRLQAELQLFEDTGRPLATNRNYLRNDALVDGILPRDGEYFVRVSQFTYTLGGPDSFYRLTVSTTPWIDAVFPPMVEAGKESKVTVYGRNLPGGVPDPTTVSSNSRPLEKVEMVVKAPETAKRASLDYRGFVPPISSGLDGFEFRLKNEAGSSNPYFMTIASAGVVLDGLGNDSPETAQRITLPCELAGRIERRRDVDWFSFAAKKGEVLSIELFGDRIGSATDYHLAVFGSNSARALLEGDESPDTLSQNHFFTRSEDPPRLRLVTPEDGDYKLRVTSRESFAQAGPRELYRLRIAPEKPDFRLVVLPGSFHQPESATIGRGGNQNFMVYVWRNDGFDGPIDLTVEDLPPGVTAAPQTIGSGLKQAPLIISANTDAKSWQGTIRVKGTAIIGGQSVVREARPASVSWGLPLQQNQQQPNTPLISRVDRELALAVREKPSFRLSVPETRFVVSAGEKLTVPVKIDRLEAEFKGPVQIFGLALPTNLVLGQGGGNNQSVTLAPDKGSVDAVFDVRAGIAPGTYTFALRGSAAVPFARDSEGKTKGTANILAPTTPITITVVPKEVVGVSLLPADVKAARGKEVPVTVKVNRLHGYSGALKVELLAGDASRGVKAEPVTIGEGKDEAVLKVRVPDDATVGPVSKLLVRVTATVEGNKNLMHEVKLSMTIGK